jgi:hypothetical protein
MTMTLKRTLEVTSQVDCFFPFWSDEYAFLTNFVEEPLSRFHLESVPNGGGNRGLSSIGKCRCQCSHSDRLHHFTGMPPKTCGDLVKLAGLPDIR